MLATSKRRPARDNSNHRPKKSNRKGRKREQPTHKGNPFRKKETVLCFKRVFSETRSYREIGRSPLEGREKRHSIGPPDRTRREYRYRGVALHLKKPGLSELLSEQRQKSKNENTKKAAKKSKKCKKARRSSRAQLSRNTDIDATHLQGFYGSKKRRPQILHHGKGSSVREILSS